MMIEYASSYGNDWYVVPLTLPVGSLTRVNSLIITDTFGVKSLVRPMGGRRASRAILFHVANRRTSDEQDSRQPAPVSNLFFLPPTFGQGHRSAMIEDVLFIARRDGEHRLGDREECRRTDRTTCRACADGDVGGQPGTSARGCWNPATVPSRVHRSEQLDSVAPRGA